MVLVQILLLVVLDRLFKLQRRVDRQTAAALDESSERASGGSAAIGGT